VIKIFSEESGQGMVEYGIILIMVALVVVSLLGALGQNSVKQLYNEIETKWPKHNF